MRAGIGAPGAVDVCNPEVTPEVTAAAAKVPSKAGPGRRVRR
jgi:hypothetical protein